MSKILVFVPSRGAIFLNAPQAEFETISNPFPSPLGELYFLIGILV